MGKVYDQAYKTEICKRIVEGGETVATISREVGIRDTTIYGWVSRYRENSEKLFVGSGHIKPEEEAFKKLLKENKELKEENEILKKAAAYFAKNLK